MCPRWVVLAPGRPVPVDWKLGRQGAQNVSVSVCEPSASDGSVPPRILPRWCNLPPGLPGLVSTEADVVVHAWWRCNRQPVAPGQGEVNAVVVSPAAAASTQGCGLYRGVPWAGNRRRRHHLPEGQSWTLRHLFLAGGSDLAPAEGHPLICVRSAPAIAVATLEALPRASHR